MDSDSHIPETNEESLIAALLFDVENLRGDGNLLLPLCHARRLTVDAFLESCPRAIYDAILQLESGAKDGKIGLSEIKTKLADTSGVDPNCAEEVDRLYGLCVSVDHGPHFLDSVVKAWTKRKIADILRRTLRICESSACQESPSNILWDLQSKLITVDNPLAVQRPFSSYVHESADDIRRLIDNGWTADMGLSTGFRGIDDLLLGLKPGLIVLAARPSVGKSALAMNIARCVATGKMIDGSLPAYGASNPRGVIFVSLEMTENQLTTRLLGQCARVNLAYAGTGVMASSSRQQAKDRLSVAEAELADEQNFPLDLFMPQSREISEVWGEIRDRVRKFRSKRGINVELVIVDYLQLLSCREFARGGRQFEVAEISAQLKRMAVELNVPVLALSQLSRATESHGSKDEKPKLSDLRDSGAIEQDADVVILLWRAAMVEALKDDVERNTEVEAKIAKNRNGKIGTVQLTYDADYTLFGDKKE